MGRSRGLWFPSVLLIALQLTAQTKPSIAIKVVQGDNAINSIRLRRGHDPVVQVFDPTGEPLHNATVSFLLPATGPSGAFGESGLSLTVQTDEKGMAVGKGMLPNRIEGQFRIRATASWRGEAASTTLSQTNAEATVSSSKKKWGILAAVIAGAAVGGVVVASKGGGSSTPAGGSTGGNTGGTGTIVPGSPTFGPPR